MCANASTSSPPPRDACGCGRLRVRLARGIECAQTSHQAFVALVIEAVQRAGLPVAHSGGPHPRVKVTPGLQLPLGYTSRCEYLDFALAQPCTGHAFASALAEQLPPGLRLLWAGRVPAHTPHPRANIVACWYTLYGALDPERAHAFRAAPQWPHAREKKGARIELDLKVLVDRIDVHSDCTLLKVRIGAGPQVKPAEVIESVFGLPEGDALRAPVERTALIMPPAPFPRSFLVE